jgi:hypothetical protein
MPDTKERLLDIEEKIKTAFLAQEGSVSETELTSMLRMHTRIAMKLYKEEIEDSNGQLGPDDIRGVLEFIKHMNDKSNEKAETVPSKPNLNELDNAITSMNLYSGLVEALSDVLPCLVETFPIAAKDVAQLCDDIAWKMRTAESMVRESLDMHIVTLAKADASSEEK